MTGWAYTGLTSRTASGLCARDGRWSDIRGLPGWVRSFYPCPCGPTMVPMTKVKICGVTRPEDALLAVELGAWAVGTTDAAESPRAGDAAAGGEVGAALKVEA